MNCAYCEDRIVRLPGERAGCSGARRLWKTHLQSCSACSELLNGVRDVMHWGRESPGSVAASVAFHPDHREHAASCSHYLEGLGRDCLEKCCRAAVRAGPADIDAHAGLDGQPRGDLCWRRCDGPPSFRDLLPDGRLGKPPLWGCRSGLLQLSSCQRDPVPDPQPYRAV